MIDFILMAIGMAISVLAEALLPSGDETTQGKGGGNGKAENAKEWLRSKLNPISTEEGESTPPSGFSSIIQK